MNTSFLFAVVIGVSADVPFAVEYQLDAPGSQSSANLLNSICVGSNTARQTVQTNRPCFVRSTDRAGHDWLSPAAANPAAVFRGVVAPNAGNPVFHQMAKTELGTLAIAQIWSDQVPNRQFNSLPADAAANTGAGEYGSQLGLIVMGARSDNKGYVKCEIKLDSDNPSSRTNIVLRLINSEGEGEVLAEPLWNAARDIASFCVPVPGKAIRCTVEGWLDLDGNGILNPENNEVLVKAPGKFVILSKSGYETAINSLRNKVVLGIVGTIMPVAYRFLGAFLNHTAPQYSVDQGDMVVSPNGDLDHNAGVEFDSRGQAQMPVYQFGANSDVAARIFQSSALKELAVKAVAANQPHILAAFEDGTRTDFTFDLGGDSVPCVFPNLDNQPLLDWDLYYSFHGTTLLNPKITVFRSNLTQVHLQGILTDIYDFQWDVGALSSLACQVQAGYPTLGVSGGVFGIRVSLDGDIDNVRYSGYPSLKIGWVDRSNGRKLVLECTHASATPALIEHSADLKSWETLGTNQLNGSVSYVDLDTLMRQQTQCYFRMRQ
jgi:hypothetical protein